MIGARTLSLDNEFGTIRFVGAIPDSSSTWFGVEWDRPVGSNDGEARGTRFFRTAPHCASFFKCSARTGWPAKLRAPLSLAAAIEQRYAAAPLAADAHVAVFTSRKINTALDALAVVSVHALPCQLQPPASRALLRQLTRLRMLDLSRTLTCQWHAIDETMAHCVSSLKTLSLSGNRLRALPAADSLALRQFARLDTLVLNTALVHLSDPWPQLVAPLVNNAAPQLAELCLAHNQLRSLAAPPSLRAERLARLDLSFNQLHSWPQLCAALCAASNLRVLELSSNALRGLPAVQTPLTSLVELNVIKQSVGDARAWTWTDLCGLAPAQLPRLARIALPFRNLALGETDVDVFSAALRLLVALKPTLTHVNRCDVSADERREAPIDFLAHVDNKRQPSVAGVEWIQERYRELDAAHATRAKPSRATHEPSSLAARMTTLFAAISDSGAFADSLAAKCHVTASAVCMPSTTTLLVAHRLLRNALDSDKRPKRSTPIALYSPTRQFIERLDTRNHKTLQDYCIERDSIICFAAPP